MSILMLCMLSQGENNLADVRVGIGLDRDIELNLSAFTAVLGKSFGPWVTTFCCQTPRRVGKTIMRRNTGTTPQ